jgi:signal transduction histidine kinase
VPASLTSRLLTAFLLPTLLLFGVAGLAGYVVTRGILEGELGQNLSNVAGAAASQLSGDRLLSIEPGDEGAQTRTHRNLLRTLGQIKDATGARRLVAFDRQGRVRVDTEAQVPVGAELPELARDRLELLRVWEGERSASQVLFEGFDGRLYKTGYAPVLAEEGVVAAVAAEGSAEFYRPMRRLLWAYALLVLSALLLLAAVAVGVARTLTGPIRRLMDAALRIGAGDLQTRVSPEGTVEIGTLARELEAMREALESRDRQLKMMLAGVAHEVRNPIGGIELFAGLLGEELQGGAPDLQEARGQVHRIREEIAYLKRIVEDFLAFAREQRLNLAKVSAPRLLAQAMELLEADAARRKVVVTLEAQEAMVQGDESLLVALLVNLLKNAVQASPEGAGVRLRGAVADRGYQVEVEDGGAGIAAEVQARIFEPFFTTKEKGSGLGLALAHKIARAHHGELGFESTPGRTVFRLWLPRT